MVFNFTARHDHGFKNCQTRWPLIGLKNLILIGQLRIWWKHSHLRRCKWFKYRMLSFKLKKCKQSSKYRKLPNLSSYTECITIVWFDSKFFLFDVNHMFRSLWICYHDVNLTYGNHSINQDSAHWPMGIKMLRPINGYLVRELNRDVMRN